jgi:superfamily I DNA and RNA helicase
MLDIVTGQRRNVIATRQLVETLQRADLRGTLYIGYPILASADGARIVEGLLTCEQHGVVAFDLLDDGPISMEVVAERQSDLYAAIFQKLLSFKPLRSARSLIVPINVVTLSPATFSGEPDEDVIVAPPDGVLTAIERFKEISSEHLRLVNAAIQRVATIKPVNKRQKVSRPDSRGAIMRRIESEIANLDRWQKHAAIESPAGPQRIRGLAGSGKTIVLALKAAYLHGQNPTWDIAITFQTRSLYQLFNDLVRRFCFEQFNDEPDWTKLRILHAWGSSRQPGIYSEIASAHGLPVRDFGYAKERYGADTGFRGICEELLAEVAQKPEVPRFDAVLIDEAQDLPQEFFQLVYLSTRQPKRIIWAYDELQNLGSYSMAPPAELFGFDASGNPCVPDLYALQDGAKRDIVLPVCYRNTPWALTTAHALGFGIYRDRGIVQFFDNPSLLQDVGYRVVEGELDFGNDVVLARRDDSAPEYFSKLLDPADSVQWQSFDNSEKQAEWVAEQIRANLTVDELDAKDILVILANPLTARDEAPKVMKALSAHEISSHLAGVMASVDELFQEGSVAITGIYRAKGNEAPMVYLLGSEYCAGTARFTSIKARNILFTAITRSRAWVRICGLGIDMAGLSNELTGVVQNRYRLAFRVPTRQEIEKIRRIHRDVSKEELAKIKKVERGLAEVLELIRRGEISKDDLSLDLRGEVATLLALDDTEEE